MKDYNNCFACGCENPIGLKLSFSYKDKTAFAEFSLSRNFEGYPGVIHGGIVSALLDEAMAKSFLQTGIEAVTTNLKIKFKLPVKAEEIHTLKGETIKETRRTFECHAEIVNSENQVCAFADAVFFKIKK
ncbi:MAG: thioesterase [Candidatus Cloacimonadota bacterium]|nr:MAG: thioesterase [Candidatus Cloacimonadota bacterium]